jgi:transcription initiation factor TFIID subunit 13
MYGFGDDRNPSNDTVNVMEEILIEYITDVVRTLLLHVYGPQLTSDSLH